MQKATVLPRRALETEPQSIRAVEVCASIGRAKSLQPNNAKLRPISQAMRRLVGCDWLMSYVQTWSDVLKKSIPCRSVYSEARKRESQEWKRFGLRCQTEGTNCDFKFSVL